MPVSRREFLLTAAALAATASCSAIPEPICCKQAAPSCPAPQPLPIPLQAERCELFAFDEIHRAMPTVYRPRSEGELAELLKSVPAGRHVTFRGGGQSLDSQSLNDDLVVIIDPSKDPTGFGHVGMPERDDDGFFVTMGAGVRWWEVLERLAPHGLMPPSLVTAGAATVGGTMSADCVSRMSPITGKEGQQIRSFRIVLADGRMLDCRRDDPDEERGALFKSVIGGFGYLGAVTRVTFDLLVARSNPGVHGDPPRVLTRSTRNGPSVDWDAALRQLLVRTVNSRRRFDASKQSHRGGTRRARKSDPAPLARTPEWAALSVASFFMGPGMGANILEQRFVEGVPLKPVPGGVYDKDASFPAVAEETIPIWPTLTELGLELGFPEGEYVDELFGWAFFLGNSATRAKACLHRSGTRLNLTQQTFVLPSRIGGSDDTRPTRRFVELLEARLHAADVRPADVDFLYVPQDSFLMSASRGLPGFVVTMTLADRNQEKLAPEFDETLRALSHDCRTLGGRVHLVKNVVADASDLRAMHGDAALELRTLKQRFDPKGLFRNEFFARVFEA